MEAPSQILATWLILNLQSIQNVLAHKVPLRQMSTPHPDPPSLPNPTAAYTSSDGMSEATTGWEAILLHVMAAALHVLF